jgi:hypothetical protein
MNPEITAKGFGKAEAALREIGERGLDPRPAFEATTDVLIVAQKRRFRALGHPKASTAQAKARDRDPRVRAHAGESGVATGELRDYMTMRGRDAQPAKLTRDEMEFGVPRDHPLYVRAAGLAKIGKSPLVSRDVVRRAATQALTDHLGGKP